MSTTTQPAATPTEAALDELRAALGEEAVLTGEAMSEFVDVPAPWKA